LQREGFERLAASGAFEVFMVAPKTLEGVERREIDVRSLIDSQLEGKQLREMDERVSVVAEPIYDGQMPQEWRVSHQTVQVEVLVGELSERNSEFSFFYLV
jgi:hypothetical protein